MPKLKSNRGAAKRFRMSAGGKIKRKKAYLSHLLSNKSRKRKRNLRKSGFVCGSDKTHIKRLLPYL